MENVHEHCPRQLIWLRLVNRAERPSAPNSPPEADDEQLADGKRAPRSDQNDVTLLSLNRRLITPDRRFKVGHQPPLRWTLTIENVGLADDRAFYLCQASGTADEKDHQQQAGEQAQPAAAGGARFIGGAKLNVLGE